MRTLYREFETQAQIDAQYNPSLSLAADDNPMLHYARTAERARAQLHGVLDIHFGPTLAETLDIFPASQPNAPAFIFLHGGYWRALSSTDFSGIALGLHAQGITTVVINYALCPVVTIDEIVRQCRAACAWVFRHIAEHGGNPLRVAIGGHSAGGHLTAMCLQTPWERDYGLPQDPFAAAVLVSGLYDLAPLRYSYLQPMIQLDEGTIARNSPVLGARPCTTPVWITWGGAETSEFARQSQVFHNTWLAQGNRALLEAQPGANHFTAIHGFEEAGSPLCSWLQNSLARKNTS
jgi:arylformamidase